MSEVVQFRSDGSKFNWRFWTRFFGYGWMFGGIIALLLGTVFYFQTRAYVGRAKLVPAKVVALKEHRNEHGSAYEPVFEYTDAMGHTYRSISEAAQDPAPYAVGNVIQVLCDPDNPNDIRENTFASLWLEIIVDFFLAAFFLIAGLFIAWLAPPYVERLAQRKARTIIPLERGHG